MKVALILLTIILEVLSCDHQTDNFFKVKVIGKGMDCGDIYLVEFQEKLEEVYQIVGSKHWNTFYADSLPTEFKKKGITIFIKFRKPSKNEIRPCTARGPAFPLIIITDVKKE